MVGLLLLSGGIDSPIAGWKMKQLGVDLIAVHFSLEPLTTDESVRKAIKLGKTIGIKKLYVCRFGEIQSDISKKCTHRYFYVLTRRIMFRIAEEIAAKECCEFLVTGESIAQVGSQTIENMACIQDSVKIPVLQPILTNDKNETIELARAIGTYEISKGPEMCSILGPKHPATKSVLNVIRAEEKKIDFNEIVKNPILELKAL